MRISDIIKPLYEDELKMIPPSTLAVKSFEGTEKHKRMEVAIINRLVNLKGNSIESLYVDACRSLTLDPEGNVEEELVREAVTGHPDFYDRSSVRDWKFTLKLANHVALQLIGYEWLAALTHEAGSYLPAAELELRTDHKLLAYHYPSKEGLFVHQVNAAAKPVLRDFFHKLRKNHAKIVSDPMEKLAMLVEWDKIQEEHDIFRLVATALYAPTITSYDGAEDAVAVLTVMAQLEKHQKFLKTELKRFMKEEGITKLETEHKNISLYTGERKNYKVPDEIKEKYKAEPTHYDALRFSNKKRKAKLINGAKETS